MTESGEVEAIQCRLHKYKNDEWKLHEPIWKEMVNIFCIRDMGVQICPIQKKKITILSKLKRFSWSCFGLIKKKLLKQNNDKLMIFMK
jgi:hypothetical protein